MSSTLVDIAKLSLCAESPAELGLRLPNLLACLQRQREEMQQDALAALPSPVSIVPNGDQGHEHQEVDHRRS